MPHPEKPIRWLHSVRNSVRNFFYSGIEQRPESAEIKEEPASLISLPHEIIEDQLASYLTCDELNAFMNTNRFFARNEALDQVRLTAERPLKMAVGPSVTLQFSVFGPLVQWGVSRYNKPGFIPINLSPGEWIREVVVREDFSLLLTSHHRVMVNGYCSFIPLRQAASSAKGFNECLIDGLEPNERVIKIAASDDYCVLLTSVNQVLVCGSNQCGELGLAHQKSQKGFKKATLELLDNEWVIDVAVSGSYTLLRTNRDRVLASGSNGYGQLGLSHWHNVHLFEPCPLGRVLHAKEGIKSMAVGDIHSVLLTTSSRILVSGDNGWGQLGLDQSVRCSTSFTECIIADLKPGELVARLAVGCTHTMVLTNHHRLFVCGRNDGVQLGLRSRGAHYQFRECPIDCLQANEVIIDVMAGEPYTLLTTSQKRFFVSGYNIFGQLGLDFSKLVYTTFQVHPLPIRYQPQRPLKSELKEGEPAEDSSSRCVMQ